MKTGKISQTFGEIVEELELKELKIPDGIREIEDITFDHNEFLKKVELPDSLRRIGTQAFFGCRQLETINLPPKLGIIDTEVFCYCDLRGVEIPENILIIPQNCFNNCKNLKTVSFKSKHGVVCVDMGAFSGTAIEEMIFPDGLEDIDDFTFLQCKQLKKVVLPKSLTFVGEEAFRHCPNVEVTFIGKTMENIRQMNYFPWGLEKSQIKFQP